MINRQSNYKSLLDAWKVLDANYSEVRAKLKQIILGIELKPTNSNLKMVKLLQFVSTKIYAADEASMLKVDQE